MNIWVNIRSRISEDQLVSIKSYLLKADDSETLELPNKPSIAVLPFENMSGDPDQDYFSDGLTEQIIMGFSKVPILITGFNYPTFFGYYFHICSPILCSFRQRLIFGKLYIRYTQPTLWLNDGLRLLIHNPN